MKALLLILLIAISVSAQNVRYDKFTDTRYIVSKEVTAYKGRYGLLVYNPSSVRLQTGFTNKSSIPALFITVDSSDWQFTNGCSVEFLADGERFHLPCEVSHYQAYTLQSSVYVEEDLSIASPLLVKILNSQKVEMRVGAYEFSVKEKDLKALRLAIPPSP